MSATLPQQARRQTLQRMVDLFLEGQSRMGLLGAALVVTDATTLADCLAVEATFAGYVPLVLFGWSAVGPAPGGEIASFINGRFVPTGAGGTGPIYGYFLCDILATRFYGVEAYTTAPESTPQLTPYDVYLEYKCFTQF